jgi:hypothetical protein
VSKIPIKSFAISIEGYGAGPNQDQEQFMLFSTTKLRKLSDIYELVKSLAIHLRQNRRMNNNAPPNSNISLNFW